MVSERLVKEKLKNSPKTTNLLLRSERHETRACEATTYAVSQYWPNNIGRLWSVPNNISNPVYFYISINCSLLTHRCLCNPAHIDDISISYILGFPYIVNNNEQTLLVKIPLSNSSISNTSFWWIITLVDGGEEYDGPADVEQDHAERHARGHQEKVLGNTAN